MHWLIRLFLPQLWLNGLTLGWRLLWLPWVFTVLFLIYSISLGERHWHVGGQHHRIPQTRFWFYGILVASFAIIVVAMRFGLFPSVQHTSRLWIIGISSLVGLVSCALLIDIRTFLSKQFAIWRKIGRATRHHRIRTDFVPTEEPVRWSDRVVSRWSQLGMYIHDDRFMFIVALLIGGLIIPILKVATEDGFMTITLSPLGLSIGVSTVITDLSRMVGAFFPEGLVSVAVIFGMLLALSYFLRRRGAKG